MCYNIVRGFPQRPRRLCFLWATDRAGTQQWGKAAAWMSNQGYRSFVRVFSWFIKMKKEKNTSKEKTLVSWASYLPGERAADIFGTLSQKARGTSENPSPVRVVCIILASGPSSSGTLPQRTILLLIPESPEGTPVC